MDTKSFDIFTKPETPNHEPTNPDTLEFNHSDNGGPNRSNKDVADDVIRVFYKLGGVQWLLQQAALNPKVFIDLLKRCLPKEINLDTDTTFTLNLVNSYIQKNTGVIDNQDTEEQQVIDIKEYTVQ